MPLKARLIRYLKNNPGWHPSIALQKLTLEKGAGTGKTCTRRLQEAAEDGVLEVSYVRGAAQYRFKAPNTPPSAILSVPGPVFNLPSTLKAMEVYFNSI